MLSVALSPDRGILASGSADKTIRLWQMRNRRLIATLTGHESSVKCVEFSPDGQILASGDGVGNIFIWNIISKERMANFRQNPRVVSAINTLSSVPMEVYLQLGVVCSLIVFGKLPLPSGI